MNAIQVTCPNCGARLSAGNADVVTCSYCGTEARIQRRTRVFERVLPPPPAQNRPVQIAVQARSKAAVIILMFTIGLPILITVVVLVAVRNIQGAVSRNIAKVIPSIPKTKFVAPEDRPPTWQGTDGVLLFDVNGDGTTDLVGRGRQVNRGDIVVILALDGTNGKTLWQSDVLGTYTETYQGPLALAADTILFGNDKGEVQAFDVKTGKQRWKTATPERIESFCVGDAFNVIALGKDDMLRPLAITDGTLGIEKKVPKRKDDWDSFHKPKCAQLPDDRRLEYEGSKEQGATSELRKKLGLYVEGYVTVPSGGRIVGAQREKGTNVTTIVALDEHEKERWRIVPSSNPLGSDGTPRYLAAGAAHVCADWPDSKGEQIGCFALADGAKLWEAPAISFLSGLAVVGNSLIIVAHHGIGMYDAQTGKPRWKTFDD